MSQAFFFLPAVLFCLSFRTWFKVSASISSCFFCCFFSQNNSSGSQSPSDIFILSLCDRREPGFSASSMLSSVLRARCLSNHIHIDAGPTSLQCLTGDVLHPAPSSSSQTLSMYRCWWRSFWMRRSHSCLVLLQCSECRFTSCYWPGL